MTYRRGLDVVLPLNGLVLSEDLSQSPGSRSSEVVALEKEHPRQSVSLPWL